MRKFLIVILLIMPYAIKAVSLSEQPHHTTAYIAPAGSVDILTAYSSYKTDHFWNKKGNKLSTHNTFHRRSAILYAEFALNCRNSFWIYEGYSKVNESMNGNSGAFEDVELGWKHLIFSTETAALTSQFITIIPTGKRKSSVRYGKFDFEADLLFSNTYTLFNKCGWYDLGLGYRFYQDYPSDQVRAQAAIGYCLTNRFIIIASANLDYGVFNGKCSFNMNNVVLNPNYRLFEGSIEAVYRLMPHVSINFGGFKHFWGENVGTGGGFYAGAWFDF